MRKISAILFSILLVCASGLLLTACGGDDGQGNGGNDNGGDGDACAHTLNQSGICTLCQEDFMSKWEKALEDTSAYRACGEKEYKMTITYYDYDGDEEITIIKSEKNKAKVDEYIVVDGEWVEREGVYTAYIEDFPEQFKRVFYKKDGSVSGEENFANKTQWEQYKKHIDENGYSPYSYVTAVTNPAFEPELLEIKYLGNGKYSVKHFAKIVFGSSDSGYITTTVENGLIVSVVGTNANAQTTNDIMAKIDISYEDVTIVIPSK